MPYSNQYTGVKRIILAAGNSYRALVWLCKHEAAFRQELLFCSLLCLVSFWMDISLYEQLALITVLLLVLLTEVVNTAIEAAIDRIGSEHHKLSGLAKDLGSLAVSISILIATATWLTVLFNQGS